MFYSRIKVNYFILLMYSFWNFVFLRYKFRWFFKQFILKVIHFKFNIQLVFIIFSIFNGSLQYL